MATPTTLPATFVAGNVLTAAQMNNLRGAFRILQVVSATKTDTFTTTSTTYTDVTGLSVTITPSATSSTILVFASFYGCNDVGVTDGLFRLVRGTTAIFAGDTAGNRQSGMYFQSSAASQINCVSAVTLDSPATTSATTYKAQCKNTGAGTFYVNRSKTDTDASGFGRTASGITVMEISA